MDPKVLEARTRAVREAAERVHPAIATIHGTIGARSLKQVESDIQACLDAATCGEYDDQEWFVSGPIGVHFDRSGPSGRNYWDLFSVYVLADQGRCYYRDIHTHDTRGTE